jgi:hypothetical protein
MLSSEVGGAGPGRPRCCGGPPSRAPRSRMVFTTRRTCDALTLKPEAALRRDSELDLAHEPYGGLENLRGSAIATIVAMTSPGHPRFPIVLPSHRWSAAI